MGRRKQPLVVAYGMGRDSTAMLVGLRRKRIRPDLIIFSDTGAETPWTYKYKEVMDEYLRRAGFPEITVVRYQAKNFKHFPPYRSLEENCLTNATLPSIAFGFGSCSQKWKQAPQHTYCRKWKPAIACWAHGLKVVKLIGYDDGKRDKVRRHNADKIDDKWYTYRYPLQEWGWDRDRCAEEIENAGLPIPEKSACWFCTAMKPWEVERLPKNLLRRIIIMEGRANTRLHTVEGLWRKGTKKRPGSMTEFIRQKRLLPAREIDRLYNILPADLVSQHEAYAKGSPIPTWPEFFRQLAQYKGKMKLKGVSTVQIDQFRKQQDEESGSTPLFCGGN